MKNIAPKSSRHFALLKLSLPPALSPAQQQKAFSEFAEATHALRSHLHACDKAAQYILALAKTCTTGATGTKNDAKKYFEAGSLNSAKLRACETAPDTDSLSEALHDLGGKAALYEECLEIASESGAGKPSTTEAGFCTAKLEQLKSVYFAKRNVIVQANLRLAASVANKHRRGTMDAEDLLQHAAVALQKAVESFKASRGIQFSTFATTVIQNDLKRVWENSAYQIRVPCHLHTKIRKLNEARQELASVLGHKPALEQLAAVLDMSVRELVQLEQAHLEPISLSTPVGDEDDDCTLGDTLALEGTQCHGWDPNRFAECIQPFEAQLDFHEQTFLRKYAGYGFGRRMDVDEIAADHGMTPAEVRRTIIGGLEKIRLETELVKKAA